MALTVGSVSLPTAEGAGSGRLGAGAATFFGIVVMFVAAQLTILGAGVLLTRPLWLDEIHTVLVAGAPSMAETVRSLALGVDFNPPTAYWLYRLASWLPGGLSEIPLRVIAGLCVAGALTIVYVLLRERFGRLASAAGVLAVWSQPVVVSAAFEARFYGPWLFAAGWLLLAIRQVERPARGRLAAVSLAMAAMATCTVHYFGVLSWAAAVGVTGVRGRRDPLGTARRLAPALAGPVALAACVPLYLHQRAALSVPTWIPGVSLGGLAFLLAVLLLPPSTIAAVVCRAVVRARRDQGFSVRRRGGADGAASSALLLGQTLVPLVLAVLSLFGEPFTQPRYWIVGSLAAGPIAAGAIERCGRALGSVIIAVSFAWSVATMRAQRTTAERQSARVEQDIAIVSRVSGSGDLVVFRRRHSLYPVWRAKPALAGHLALLDATAVHPADRFQAVERDVAAAHYRRYGFPRVVTLTELAAIGSFYVVELYDDRAPQPSEFPGRVIRRQAPRLFWVTRE